ncbi:hypothetical protein BRADI_3g34276v3 [Brachypodium distachyon]|uniref:Uncharacterized protein n=1 Tax=Brachypodium distachyon TaxID=15368 RepID=A0A2K2D106_BRADI|nr:hypothetical protein BRADI_3g34276v3 [Brachypodium distachyon]
MTKGPDLFAVLMELPMAKAWVPERMCLDYCAGKDNISDAIIFFVVQGEFRSNAPGSPRNHDVHITTLEVKTEMTGSRTRKPKKIEHVDICTCFIEHDEELVRTKRCYAVGLDEELAHTKRCYAVRTKRLFKCLVLVSC